jgi:hypothetical protein
MAVDKQDLGCTKLQSLLLPSHSWLVRNGDSIWGVDEDTTDLDDSLTKAKDASGATASTASCRAVIRVRGVLRDSHLQGPPKHFSCNPYSHQEKTARFFCVVRFEVAIYTTHLGKEYDVAYLPSPTRSSNHTIFDTRLSSLYSTHSCRKRGKLSVVSMVMAVVSEGISRKAVVKPVSS